MTCAVDDQGWVRCPVCGGKTRTKVRNDTVLVNFPLFCPKCHRESTVSLGRETKPPSRAAIRPRACEGG